MFNWLRWEVSLLILFDVPISRDIQSRPPRSDDFPAIFQPNLLRNVLWFKAQDISELNWCYKIFNGFVCFFNILQEISADPLFRLNPSSGTLSARELPDPYCKGDPSLLAALFSLSQMPRLLQRIAPPEQNFDSNYCGMFKWVQSDQKHHEAMKEVFSCSFIKWFNSPSLSLIKRSSAFFFSMLWIELDHMLTRAIWNSQQKPLKCEEQKLICSSHLSRVKMFINHAISRR